MKNILKILITIFLLLNLTFLSVNSSFPKSQCNGFCEIGYSAFRCHESGFAKLTCCDVMKNNSNNYFNLSSKISTKFSDISCTLVIHEKSLIPYLIPKSSCDNIESSQITAALLIKENLKIKFINLKSRFSIRDKPPIYLFNKSFLI